MDVELIQIADIFSGKDYKANPAGEAYPIYGTGGVMGFTSIPLHKGPAILSGRKGSINNPIYLEGAFWNVDTIFCIKPKDNVDAKWLYYNFKHTDLNKLNEATGVPSVSSSSLYKLRFRWFDKPEQICIARILSKADTGKDQLEKLITKYQRIKTGLMQDLLTKGIDLNGNIRSKASHTFVVKNGIEVPEEWDVKLLGRLAQFKSGYAFKFEQLTEFGHKVVRITNLHTKGFPYWYYDGPIKETWVVKEGDILFTWAGVATSIDCIKYHGEKALLNQHIYNFNFENAVIKEFTYKYLQYFLPKLRLEIEGGAGQLHLTKEKIQSIKIPFMQLGEMDAINTRLNEIENTIEKTRRQLSKLNSLKKGLMQDLLSGKVRVKIKEAQIV